METIIETIKEFEGSFALEIAFQNFPNIIYEVGRESLLIVGIGEKNGFELFMIKEIHA